MTRFSMCPFLGHIVERTRSWSLSPASLSLRLSRDAERCSAQPAIPFRRLPETRTTRKAKTPQGGPGWAVGQFQVHRWGYERAEGSKCPEHMGATGRHRDPDLKAHRTASLSDSMDPGQGLPPVSALWRKFPGPEGASCGWVRPTRGMLSGRPGLTTVVLRRCDFLLNLITSRFAYANSVSADRSHS